MIDMTGITETVHKCVEKKRNLVTSRSSNAINLADVKPLAELVHPKAKGGVGSEVEALRHRSVGRVVGTGGGEGVGGSFHLIEQRLQQRLHGTVGQRTPEVGHEPSPEVVKPNLKKRARIRTVAITIISMVAIVFVIIT